MNRIVKTIATAALGLAALVASSCMGSVALPQPQPLPQVTRQCDAGQLGHVAYAVRLQVRCVRQGGHFEWRATGR